jgi:BirA family biotin operon repressor/biotin-[acetyl-CoA-carboxylase] ligase
MLAAAPGSLSGQEISRRLGVTRGAVWKEMDALRAEGWPIASSTRLGYRLTGEPPVLSAGYLSALLGEENRFAHRLTVADRVDSTNTQLKALAAQGAPEGTALLAEEQTAGRGTRGRSFQSPRGQGVYLSVLLRPRVELEQLLTLTGWVAVAARRAIVRASGAPAGIKWLNDLWVNGKKACGILTELSLLGESGEPDYVVVGIGVNVAQTADLFRAQGLGDIATSLAAEGYPVGRNRLAACLLEELDALCRAFPTAPDYWDEYRANCITLGRRVTFQQNGRDVCGVARDVDRRFALLVDVDGETRAVSSGTVTQEAGA